MAILFCVLIQPHVYLITDAVIDDDNTVNNQSFTALYCE